MSDTFTSPTTDERSDAELIAAVRAGDQASFGVLWKRHEGAARNLARQVAKPSDVDELVSESFYRVLRAISGGGGPDGAFRPYLLSTLRRVNIDVGRGYYQRVNLTDDDSDLDINLSESAADIAMDQDEQSAAWKAWASLPEATRTLLWHLIIEEETPAQIAPLLGTTPNGVSSRAVRAKERLRQAFLQQHVRDADSEKCDWTRRRLGEYARGGLSNRDQANVDRHLDECKGCTAAAADIVDVNKTLRVIIGPIVLGGAALGAKYLTAAGATHSAAATHGGTGFLGRIHVPKSHAAIAASIAAAAVVVAGVAFGLVASQSPGKHTAEPPAALGSSSAAVSSPSASAVVPPPVIPPARPTPPRPTPTPPPSPTEQPPTTPLIVPPAVPSTSATPTPGRTPTPTPTPTSGTPTRSPSPSPTPTSPTPTPTSSTPTTSSPPAPIPPTIDWASALKTTGVVDNPVDCTAGAADSFDGSGHCYPQGELEASGLAPNADVTVDGTTVTLRDYPASGASVVSPGGGPITMSGNADKIVVLGAAVNTSSALSADVLITYSDGTSTLLPVAFADWAAAPVQGTETVAQATRIGDDLDVSVFGYVLPVDPTKTLASISLSGPTTTCSSPHDCTPGLRFLAIVPHAAA